MKTAADLVSAAAEFAAGMKLGEDHLHRRQTGLVVDADRHAAAVILNRHGIILMHRDFNMIADSGQGLVDRIVDDLIDQMMKASDTGCADIHTGTFANGFQTFQNLNLIGAIFLCLFAHSMPPERI